MNKPAVNSVSLSGGALAALGLLATIYSAAGPTGLPDVPPLHEGGEFNQQYQQELRDAPDQIATHAREGWIGDRMLFLGAVLIIGGALIPLSRKRLP